MRNLTALWIGQFVSQIGDAFFVVTLSFLVLLIGGEHASFKTGMVMLMNFVPFLVIGPLAGAFVDRLPRRTVMLASDIVRAGLVISLPLLYRAGHLNWVTVGIVACLLSVARTFFDPARDALIPTLSEGRSLTRVNAVFQLSIQLSMIIGAIGVGILLGLDNSSVSAAADAGSTAELESIMNLYWVDAGTYIISVASLLFLVLPRATAHAGKVRTHPWSDVREGLGYARQSGRLTGLLFLTAADNFFIMGPAIIGANLLIKNTFTLSAQHVAMFEATLGGSWLFGTLVIMKWGTRWPKGRIILLGMILDGATYVPFYWLPNYEWSLIAIAIHGFWIPFIQVPRTTMIQENVPPAMHGRIFALVNVTVAGFTALSLAATGWLGEWLEPATLFFLGGLGGTICGLIGLRFRELKATV